MHMIAHDWEDSSCQKIFTNIANAMDSNSRLLIDDLCLADTGVDTTSASLDILMMLLTGGLERSELQWKNLVSSISPPLKIERIWTQRSDRESLIEIKRA